VHAELILVHPFREENGRLARLLALLMALQAELPPLDFSPLTRRGKRMYIAGIHAAMDRDYAPLSAMFARVIERSRRHAASNKP
jgi:cell filamentation protein